MKKGTVYTGRNLSQISFPLGGIGSGCVGLGGNGRLLDWEIFGRPAKGSTNGQTHFAIKAERAGEVLDARVLHGDEPPPYLGAGRSMYSGSGFGVSRDSLAGLPHFREVEFRGEFPVAEIAFREPRFPGRVRLQAFNPFIPLNDADSSLPAAFFAITVTNTSHDTLDYTVAFTTRNPAARGALNTASRAGGLRAITLQETVLNAADPAKGDLTIATDAAQASHQEYWFRGSWFDNLGVYWQDFTKPGALRNRRYQPEEGRGHDHATLAARVTVAPGETATVRFVLAWHYPNMTNYWNPEQCDGGECRPAVWQHYYATLFDGSAATAQYALKHWDRLQEETLRFKEALFASTLPPEVLDAVSANISLLKSPTVLRLTDGSFYGFEGCGCEAGCCEGSCQHVWNYAYALPFLFPKLERSMRELDYRYNMRGDGGMAFRLQLPIGRQRSGFRPCADGQLGGVVKTYREWKISGDTAWLKSLWPSVKQSLEFAWAPTNADRWDPDRTGVLWGRQHHTLDMELFGPNAWLTGFYLAALKAAAEMARACGEPETAEQYLDLLARGQEWVEDNLFNGEYYQQQVNLDDRSVLEPYQAADPGVFGAYWDAEHKELKYQIGAGCGIDQVLAQWHASLCGLGDIFRPGRVRKALRAIYRHNFKPSLREHFNPCRIFGLNDEAGTVMVEWPAGRRKPVVPVPYSEETMHGFEYQAACHLIMEGGVKQGLAMVRGVRDRYDGERRNPWNEIECGHNYARSMASYALLNAFSGFQFDMTQAKLSFNPLDLDQGFRCFWCLEGAWGVFEANRQKAKLKVLYGELRLERLGLPFLKGKTVKAKLGQAKAACEVRAGDVCFAEAVVIGAGEKLTVK